MQAALLMLQNLALNFYPKSASAACIHTQIYSSAIWELEKCFFFVGVGMEIAFFPFKYAIAVFPFKYLVFVMNRQTQYTF